MIIHVAKNGNDENNGLDAEHAFKTPAAAIRSAQEKYNRGSLAEPVKIVLHEGVYYLEQPLYFNTDFPLEVCPFEKDKVEISGGMELTEWKKVKLNGKTVLCTNLPENVEEVHSFYVDGKMMHPACFPKKERVHTAETLEGQFLPTADSADCIQMKEDIFDKKWYDPQNIWLEKTRLWISETLRVESCNHKEKKIKFSQEQSLQPYFSDTEYRFLNVREALTEPGEFYFDRLNHKLYYMPLSNKPFHAVLPMRGALVRISDGARFVSIHDLTFSGGGAYLPENKPEIDLRDFQISKPLTNWNAAKMGRRISGKKVYSSLQAAVHVPGVIILDNARDIAIRNCKITCSGWYGIQVNGGCRMIFLENNEICEMGAGGIKIDGPAAADPLYSPETETSRITVRNNHLHDLGFIHFAACGILLTNAWGCELEGNCIHDLFYTGISAGWVWGFSKSATHDIHILNNHIYNLGKGLLSDIGGIYTLGVQPGTRIAGNVVHDIQDRYYGAWGIYMDEGSSHIIIEKNLVYNCAREAFHQHYGRENTLRNNILSLGKDNVIRVTRHREDGYTAPGKLSSHDVNFINNLILSDGAPFVTVADPAMIPDKYIYSDYNVFYDVSGKQPFFGRTEWHGERKYNLKEWQKNGFDKHSTFGKDPGIMDILKRDFRLKKDSILRDIGIDWL